MNAITEEKIIEAAEKLAAAGKNPTQVTVREALGGGSFATIGPILKAWKDGQKEDHALAEIEVPAAISERLEQLQGAVWQAAVDEAERRLIAEREALKVAQDAAAAEIAEQLESVATLEAEAEITQITISELKDRTENQSQIVKNLELELASAKDLARENSARNAASVDRAERAETQLDRAQKDAKAERDAAAKQSRDDLNELKKEHKTELESLKKDVEKARADAASSVKQTEQLEREARAFEAEKTQMQNNEKAAQSDVETMSERVKVLEEKTEEAIREASELKGELKAIKEAKDNELKQDQE